MNYLLELFLAHILGDFFLQPASWVKDKESRKLKSKYLYFHILLHFVLIILITGLLNQGEGFSLRRFFEYWKPALVISSLHFIIDTLKLYRQKPQNRNRWFFADQAMHIIVLLYVWIYEEQFRLDLSVLNDVRILAPVTAVLFLLTPTSLIIKTIIAKWPPLPTRTTENIQQNRISLENAGELIGILERILIVSFVFLGRWEGIGFLLAAKSVFRFGDLKDADNMKMTEYVLIGTLLSFGIAIVTGVIALRVMGSLRL